MYDVFHLIWGHAFILPSPHDLGGNTAPLSLSLRVSSYTDSHPLKTSSRGTIRHKLAPAACLPYLFRTGHDSIRCSAIVTSRPRRLRVIQDTRDHGAYVHNRTPRNDRLAVANNDLDYDGEILWGFNPPQPPRSCLCSGFLVPNVSHRPHESPRPTD
jgi:hypothetical protein